MTPEQEQISENLLSEMKRNKGTTNWKLFRDNNNVDPNDMVNVVKALKELEIIENFHGDTTVVRLTEKKVGFSLVLKHSDTMTKRKKIDKNK